MHTNEFYLPSISFFLSKKKDKKRTMSIKTVAQLERLDARAPTEDSTAPPLKNRVRIQLPWQSGIPT
ncbi:hypothetical protein [Halotalea alkalilenta]|uniref:hypothetical protein n=1 Tax=Halotalea alkalilenta TaxID=376489 RepID=UPI0012DDDD52|nr:hypothetical protein [Halotalea alkalilenta]